MHSQKPARDDPSRFPTRTRNCHTTHDTRETKAILGTLIPTLNRQLLTRGQDSPILSFRGVLTVAESEPSLSTRSQSEMACLTPTVMSAPARLLLTRIQMGDSLHRPFAPFSMGRCWLSQVADAGPLTVRHMFNSRSEPALSHPITACI